MRNCHKNLHLKYSLTLGIYFTKNILKNFIICLRKHTHSYRMLNHKKQIMKKKAFTIIKYLINCLTWVKKLDLFTILKNFKICQLKIISQLFHWVWNAIAIIGARESYFYLNFGLLINTATLQIQSFMRVLRQENILLLSPNCFLIKNLFS